MHPDNEEFRNVMRDAVLAAIDKCCEQFDKPRAKDEDLPSLFRALDPLAEKLWLKSVGL